jgi:hypothetical protein
MEIETAHLFLMASASAAAAMVFKSAASSANFVFMVRASRMVKKVKHTVSGAAPPLSIGGSSQPYLHKVFLSSTCNSNI